MARLTTLAALLLSLAICVTPAAAKTWTSGQTAAYTVRVPHGPAYRVEFEVPHGVTAQIAEGLVMRRHGCTSGAPGAASLEGKTFAQALRDPIEGRRTATGRGTGRVRWAEFADGTAGEKDYTLVALDPRLVKPGETEQEYYGVEVITGCLTRQAARRVVRTIRITPVEPDPAAVQQWTGGQTASYTVRVPDGPAYLVTFDVPAGITYETASFFEVDGWTSPPLVTVRDDAGDCGELRGDASHRGDTFEQALRAVGVFNKLTATGSGTGSVRWVESVTDDKRYDLMALDPRLVRRPGAFSGYFGFDFNEYYGFEIDTSCMTRATARKLVQTVALTPLAEAR